VPRDLPFIADLGVPLALLGMERYDVPAGGAGPLDPEDAALLGVGRPGRPG
jgi:hypothetical protein